MTSWAPKFHTAVRVEFVDNGRSASVLSISVSIEEAYSDILGHVAMSSYLLYLLPRHNFLVPEQMTAREKAWVSLSLVAGLWGSRGGHCGALEPRTAVRSAINRPESAIMCKSPLSKMPCPPVSDSLWGNRFAEIKLHTCCSTIRLHYGRGVPGWVRGSGKYCLTRSRAIRWEIYIRLNFEIWTDSTPHNLTKS